MMGDWKRGALSGNNGFTLIEVILSTLFLSVAFAASASTVIAVINGNAAIRRIEIARVLAEQQLEQLRNLTYTDASLTAGNHQDPNNPVTATGASGGSYTRTWNVTENSPVSGTMTLAVTVQGTSSGTTHSVVVTTIRAR